MIYLRQVAGALEWTLKFSQGYRSGLQRTYRVTDVGAPGVYIELDASIYGGGAAMWKGIGPRRWEQPPTEWFAVK
jgi:hypothetical protein